MHIGTNSANHTFYIDNIPIPTKDSVRDLGVIIDNRLSFIPHIRKKVALANLKTRNILSSFRYCDLNAYRLLFLTYVLPHVEYCSEIFNPPPTTCLTKILEQPLRLFSRLVLRRLRIRFKSYSERLSILNLQSLERRRANRDMLTTFKLLRGLVDIPNFLFKLSKSPRHPLRLIHPKDIYRNKNWFSQRVISPWNKISPSLTTTTKSNSAKILIESLPNSVFHLFYS